MKSNFHLVPSCEATIGNQLASRFPNLLHKTESLAPSPCIMARAGMVGTSRSVLLQGEKRGRCVGRGFAPVASWEQPKHDGPSRLSSISMQHEPGQNACAALFLKSLTQAPSHRISCQEVESCTRAWWPSESRAPLSVSSGTHANAECCRDAAGFLRLA